MGIFDKFKNYMEKINYLEQNISINKQDYLEIYERNIALEKEITQRTEELNQANKTLLTLQHISEMMNSTTPLSSVLEQVIESLQGEFGYLHGIILKKEKDEDGEILRVVARTKSEISEQAKKFFEGEILKNQVKYENTGIIAEALRDWEVKYTNDVAEFAKSLIPDIPPEELKRILKENNSRSIVIIPLKTEGEEFGCMIVLSPRDVVGENELNFLGLFANQIEKAITIAGLFEKVKKQAITDPLTDLYNRRYFEDCLVKEAERSERLNQPFTLISLDLDYLKQINDQYGHSFGDIAIKTIGKVLKRNARSIDIPARIGGEEFNLLLPGIDSNGGLIAAERIRTAIEAEKLEKVGTITASIGVATYIEHTKSTDELLEMADQAMYKAKINGRNRVVIAKDHPKDSWQQVAINTFVDILAKQRIPVSKDLAEDLKTKLNRVNTSGATIKEMLYSVVDMLSRTYNPMHAQGITKKKVSLAIKLARKLEIPKEEIDQLKIAILLYDIGNVMLPEELFQKALPLTTKEQKLIHEHPIIAVQEILKPISSVSQIIPIIEHHHENWDGSGYPNKLSGENIPITSQVILLVDSFYALMQKRSYRAALTQEEAITIIKEDTDKKWNSTLIEAFLNIVESDY